MCVRIVHTRISNLLKSRYKKLNTAARFSGVSESGICKNNSFEEIQISLPWGIIAGKWYGPKNVRPIVGLHGWQDNAGTFDTLAPLLPKHTTFLSLDLPGHGFSSKIPDGMFYNSTDYIYLIRLLMKEYNWNKISLLTHSMSSILGFCFASLFPDKVDMLIAIDALKPHVRPTKTFPETMKNRIENFIIADARNRDKSEPPSYTYNECIERLHKGTNGSVSKESSPYMLVRNLKKSTIYPDKYFFARDNRIKYFNFNLFPQDLCLEMAAKIIAPHLFIKVLGTTYYEDKKYFDETIEILKNNSKFENYEVEGKHHVHLNEPEKISQIINPFICKYYVSEKTSKHNIINN